MYTKNTVTAALSPRKLLVCEIGLKTYILQSLYYYIMLEYYSLIMVSHCGLAL